MDTIIVLNMTLRFGQCNISWMVWSYKGYINMKRDMQSVKVMEQNKNLRKPHTLEHSR